MSNITNLDVHIVNVNHGDCIVIIGRNEDGPTFSMVIDGGSGGTISAKILTDQIDFPIDPETEKPLIHQLVASHHDRDHLGGLVKLLKEDAFAVKQAWLPVLFNPPGFPWLSHEDQATFTEDARQNPAQASRNALSQIQSLAKDALVEFDYYVSDEDLHETIEQQKSSRSIFSDDIETEKNMPAEDEAANKDISDVLETAFSSANDGEFEFLQSLTRLGARIPGVTGCGTFGDRDVPMEEFEGETHLDIQAKNLEMRRVDRPWSEYPFDVHRQDKIQIAMLATRAAYNVGLTTDFVRLCKERNIEMIMPLTKRKKVRPQDKVQIADGLSLTRLAPTYELVKEKKEKLMPPEGIFAFKALTHTVTVPNKVSYVFRLEVGESSVLLTGDSGFTDFYNWRKKTFDDARLAEMSKCQLVKVPHHGGHFEYWGKCVRKLLDESKPVGNIFVTSLGSAHKNPSFEFEETAVLIRQADQSAEFHFTNPPVKERFDDVCVDCTSDVPDMITYTTSGDGTWTLTTKAIQCQTYRV